jgi:PAS domain S-box-containing protein
VTTPHPTPTTRPEELFREDWNTVARQTSRLFGWLLTLQWLTAVALAVVVSPVAWAGEVSRVHPHVWAATGVGGLLVSCPVWLAFKHPIWWFTRHAVAVAQMGIGGILIHLLGGRIETHFHIFGSLAFLSFYRDWRPLVTATVVVVTDHIARGAVWPVSIYGVPGGAEWRWVEHATWVVFENAFLLVAIRQSVREMRASADRQARLEQTNEVIERTVETRTCELRASEERYRQLFEANPYPMWVFAPDTFHFLAVNEAAVTHYGYPRDQFLTLTVADLEAAPTEGAVTPADSSPIPGRSGQVYAHRRANGEVRQMELSAHPIDFGGRATLLALAVDVTDRRVLEEQLKQAQKLESIGQLAAGIAHEINTPIQYIGDNANFLGDAFRDLSGVLATYRRAKGDPAIVARADAQAAASDLGYLMGEVPRAVEQMRDGVRQVARIVKAMKEFSHPGSAEKSSVDLNRALETVLTVARNEWKYVAEVTTRFDPELPPIRGLPGELNQVFLNLIVNAAHAVRAANPGGGRGTIAVTTHKLANMAEVRIADSGCGIPPHIRRRVFDPFFTTKPVGQGTGQGLAIAHTVVVKQHDGVITFDSEVGRGTTFVVRLPVDGTRLTQSERVPVTAATRGPVVTFGGVT